MSRRRAGCDVDPRAVAGCMDCMVSQGCGVVLPKSSDKRAETYKHYTVLYQCLLHLALINCTKRFKTVLKVSQTVVVPDLAHPNYHAMSCSGVRSVQIDPSRELLFVKGHVPGQNGGFLRVTDAIK